MTCIRKWCTYFATHPTFTVTLLYITAIVVGNRYCAVKEEKSNLLYVVADAFREKLSQIVGREMRVVAQFHGDYLVMLFVNVAGHFSLDLTKGCQCICQIFQ